MTIRVAVAGATNALGHAIVSGLLEESDIQVVLLTRQSSANTKDLSHYTSRGVELHPVDYTSIPQLTSALAGVETVIVTLFSHDITPVVNLIEASKAAGVKRFAPSEFTFTSKANARLDLFEPKRRILEKVKESGLEYTLFQNGIFADFFALNAPKSTAAIPSNLLTPLLWIYPPTRQLFLELEMNPFLLLHSMISAVSLQVL